MRFVCLSLALCSLSILQAQKTNEIRFHSPVDYKMTLAGNFGEPRPNHFHCGIDVRTAGVEGKAMYSLADGYVSRITIGHSGFGLALYVTHPNEGYTSVYCHLRNFVPKLADIVKRHRYAHEVDLVDIDLGPDDFPVKAGQLIAYSGNSGASTGPHLHLELWRTSDGALIDPLPFFTPLLRDNIRPKAHAVMLYPKYNKGLINGSNEIGRAHV